MQGKIFQLNNNKQTIYIVFIMLFFTLSLHLLISYLQVNHQKQFAESLLTKAENISNDIVASIQEVATLSPNRCDSDSINTLRIILSKYEYTHDLGLIFDGKVGCSANWGQFETPILFAREFYSSSSGYQFASKVGNIFPVPARYDITKKDNVIAFTINEPFKSFDHLEKGFSYKIISKNESHTFHNYKSEYQFKKDTLLNSQELKICSSKFEYCVETLNNRPGLLYLPIFISSSLICLIGLISFLIAYSVISYFDKNSSIEFRLRKAIKNGELYLEYQPIIELKNNKIIGVESLVRWKDAVHGNVSPELFLSIAEQLGLYSTLAYDLVKRAFAELSAILHRDPEFTVAINVNAYEIKTSEYLDNLYELCMGYKIKPQQVKIEITERIGLPLEELSNFATRAKHYGFIIALDDFGTGVSNLVWLTEINFDIIKIDKILTQSITDEFKQDMVLAIMSLVTNLNRLVIFEGVEVFEEYNFIKAFNPNHQIQGWYFYKSLPLTELNKALDGQQG
ncbi:EAL domain-containing protein [Pseudoalteromonas sp. NFXS39]|uniref:EAL domain-containing protein n=1 Tax=Pseudoalteromonas sp. NFXS39 TaxID=2818437 RepID=UPI0032DFC687